MRNCQCPRHARRRGRGQCPHSTNEGEIQLIIQHDKAKLLADHRGSSAYVPGDGLSISEKRGFLGTDHFIVLTFGGNSCRALASFLRFIYLLILGGLKATIDRAVDSHLKAKTMTQVPNM